MVADAPAFGKLRVGPAVGGGCDGRWSSWTRGRATSDEFAVNDLDKQIGFDLVDLDGHPVGCLEMQLGAQI